MVCPACGSSRVYPSRTRNIVERLRKALSVKVPHRCHECGRRRWAPVETLASGPDVSPDDLRTARPTRNVSPAELDKLDPSP